jgi:hypothetical protein
MRESFKTIIDYLKQQAELYDTECQDKETYNEIELVKMETFSKAFKFCASLLESNVSLHKPTN